ncbi:MAG: valine--tRNA ligase [Prevotellaceae bacterium]|jgi:valyl-tRNA synthetase|nr:valine--tRNA ligase [Prevotellaceae bacterium]
MELSAKYNPTEIEGKWYAYWMAHQLFHSEPDEREPYTIVIPPPNVTGVLHMGHMLNNTIQDVLVRRARMQGKNACWVPGTDHASIATEAKVVAKLANEGIHKADLTREQFLEYAWEWTRKHGGIILEQLKKLGASCDWDRMNFTMNEAYSRSVIRVFVDLFNKGKIYRGVRMVNWDPKALTAVSDEEVIHKEELGRLYYIRYKIKQPQNPPAPEGGTPCDYCVVATTRPETIMGDTAVAIHPHDPKNAHLRGKTVIVPLINREVPIIEDEYIDIEFGTGCLKVTPAHDANDYLLGEKHRLEVIDIFNNDGTLNEKAQIYVGQERFAVREQIVKDLEAVGLLEKVESYLHKVGFSERTDVAIEPKLSMQWFVKMGELAEPALAAVMDDEVLLYPAKFKNTYRHWMTTIKDWCISRQLWWGHRIPAWYLPDGRFVVAEDSAEALKLAKAMTKNKSLAITDLQQDNDCLDTWFSSWLWPIAVFDPDVPGSGEEVDPNIDLQYYYPTSDLVTAPEILFFWVARMLMAGYEWAGGYPFKNVYLTGIVRDHLGRKMSKQLGNSPDPIALMDQYGADGVRMGMLLTSPAGNDLPFDEALCEQGRNFCNKIWNAFRLVNGWQADDTKEQPAHSAKAGEWFKHLLRKTVIEMNDDFDKYRLSEALMKIYKLFWNDFCAWYLEIVKPPSGQAIDGTTHATARLFFDYLLRLLHPFMPFISEEIWQHLQPRQPGESLMMQPQPYADCFDEDCLAHFEMIQQAIASVRTIRQTKNIPYREPLELYVKGEADETLFPLLQKMANLSAIRPGGPDGSRNVVSFLIGTTEFFVPLGAMLNVEEERRKLLADLEYQQQFVAAVKQKLCNERFILHAPEQVVAFERKKQADGEARIKAIEEQLAALQ